MTEYLTFQAGSETWALPLRSIREIIQPPPITRIPFTSPALPGVINLRGQLLPVLDLAAHLERNTENSNKNCLLIVERRDEQFGPEGMGLRVDSVSVVLELTAEEVNAVPAFGSEVRADFLSGILRLDTALIPVLNLETLLAQSELSHYIHGA
ncbi:MAG: purine-binding chemotaxis protein CheW [Spirochaetales bacterium]|nr:purine-binding chemotaxis protein CheW [Spirochaetales bacterium]